MSAVNLRGELLPGGAVEFEHGVENHPDFEQLAEDVYGDMIADKALMQREWWEWVRQGMPGLRERLEDRGPRGDEVATYQPFSVEQVERELGRHMRNVFHERIGKEADEEAGRLLSKPAHLAQWRKEREEQQAERQWEERSGARQVAA